MLGEEDRAILADDHDSAVDAVTLWLECAVGAGNMETLVDKEIERKVLFLDEFQVTGGVGLIDAVWLGFQGSKRVDRIAHGGELIRSARGAIARVEEEGNTALPS